MIKFRIGSVRTEKSAILQLQFLEMEDILRERVLFIPPAGNYQIISHIRPDIVVTDKILFLPGNQKTEDKIIKYSILINFNINDPVLDIYDTTINNILKSVDLYNQHLSNTQIKENYYISVEYYDRYLLLNDIKKLEKAHDSSKYIVMGNIENIHDSINNTNLEIIL